MAPDGIGIHRPIEIAKWNPGEPVNTIVNQQATIASLREQLAAAETALANTGTSMKQWKVVLVSPTEADPFRRIDCEIIDIGYSDRAIVIAAKEMDCE